jgi:hypothetical protein
MGHRNAYKDMLDNVVSPITCVSMNHQNQLEQMANGAMFATAGHTMCPRGSREGFPCHIHQVVGLPVPLPTND